MEGNHVSTATNRLLETTMVAWEKIPLILIGLVIFIVFALIGNFISKRKKFWDRITGNPFLSEMAGQIFRMAFLVLGLVAALDAIGASSLIGAILGAAGITGIAIGFAVKDTIDNYVSSLMLSINQPFRANDYIEIGAFSGSVIRMTTRATILMTSDGNHLRLPNSLVYKSPILNYSRIPERRYAFDLSIAADDDPQAAVRAGVEAMNDLPFVLEDPPANGFVKDMGDSSIILTFRGWINQKDASFPRARSLALRAVKLKLEESGFALPNPSFNLSFDPTSGPLLADIVDGPEETRAMQKAFTEKPVKLDDLDVSNEVKGDDFIKAKVDDERKEFEDSDMLDGDKPTE